MVYNKYIVTRNISEDEAPWLPEHLREEGAIVFEFHGITYGCINYESGFAVSEVAGQNPFYEMPFTAVKLTF